jgi:hypothetical protein
VALSLVLAVFTSIAAIGARGARYTAAELGVQFSTLEATLVGVAGDDGGISGDVRLQSAGDATVSAYVTSLGWIGADPEADVPSEIPDSCILSPCIHSGRVTIDPVESDLVAGVWKSLRVSVAVVQEPGLYAGWLWIQLRPKAPPSSSASPTPALSPTLDRPIPNGEVAIPLLARIRDKGFIEPLGSMTEIQARRTHLDSWLDTALAFILLPEAERSNVVYVTSNNPGIDTLLIQSGKVWAIGERTNRALGTDATVTAAVSARIVPPLLIPPTVSTPLAIRLNLDEIESDRYRGAVYLDVNDQASLQRVDLTLTVRDGPSLALALLILGAAFGWVSKWLTDKGERILTLQSRLDGLVQRSRVRLGPQDQVGLGPSLTDAQRDIDGSEIERASERVGKIERAIDTLEGLARIVDRVPPDKADEVGDIRELAYALDVDEADKQLTALRQELGPRRDARVHPAPSVRRSNRLVLLLGVFVATVAFVGVAILSTGVQPGGIGVPPPTGIKPTPTPALPTAATAPQAHREVTAADNQVTLTVAVLILAVVVWRLPWIVGRFRGRRVGVIRSIRILIQGATLVLLVLVGLRLLYVDEGTDVIRAYVDPIYQFLLWGFGAGFGSKTLGVLLK